jgi:murein DD-endopeptidase MepM/ murein hydrolase activator NlpD
MNKIKNFLISTIFIYIPLIALLSLGFYKQERYEEPKFQYQVYLDGEKIGLIESKDELYDLINKEQIEVKKKYNTDQVYPPKGFQMVKTNTYDEKLNATEEIYEKIKEKKEFTIKGYTITIKSKEEDKEPTYIYVTKESIFEEAIKNIVNTFIGQERFKQYMDETQPEIIDVGYIIENIYFNEKITIKESFITVNEQIYKDSQELTKYLLFNKGTSSKLYTVVQGDTIESIANANELNVGELLIANDNIKDEDTLLAIGQEINVALINPVLDLVYEELVTEDIEQQYTTVYEEDNSQYVDYKQTKQKGSNGISRITTRVQFTNGEQNQGAITIGKPIVIKPVQNEIIVKGTKAYGNYSGTYVDTGDAWGWPTNQPYIITSGFEYRWGTLHEGIDISGTGYGSPIYASLDGEVVNAQYGGMVGSSAGYNVVIRHDNGYYTVYAHMAPGTIKVAVAQRVVRGQIIGGMGMSGWATGTHLHFGLYAGEPYNGGRPINPFKLWQ